MTITKVTEMWSRASHAEESSDGLTITRTYRRAFREEHSAGTSLSAIRTANDGTTAIPSVRDVYPGESEVYCTNVGGVEPVGPVMSIVPVEYEGEVGSDGSDPTTALPKIRYGSVKVTQEADRDGRGAPLTNSVGDPVKGLQGEINDFELRVQRPFLSVNGPLAQKYLQSTNSDVMNVLGDVWQPGTAHLVSYEAEPVFDKLGYVKYFNVDALVGFRYPVNTTPNRAWWYRYRNEGKRARFATTVTFTGGGGSLAAGYAIANSSGAITDVVVTCRGKNYTSAPTVSFTSTTGGSGASATATLSGDEVASVSIGAGGTGYKSGISPVLDKNKEPVTEPVLLTAAGTIETNADNAFFNERQKFPYSLPLNALGLLD